MSSSYYAMQVQDVGMPKWTTWYKSYSLEDVQDFYTKNAWEYLSMEMTVRIVRVVPDTGMIHSVIQYQVGRKSR